MTTGDEILTAIKGLPAVEQVRVWNDRAYVNLSAARGSRANADLRTKIWLRGNTLTIERGKGYHSDAFIAGENALTEAVAKAGGTVRVI